jgi:hypothetical protein
VTLGQGRTGGPFIRPSVFVRQRYGWRISPLRVNTRGCEKLTLPFVLRFLSTVPERQERSSAPCPRWPLAPREY